MQNFHFHSVAGFSAASRGPMRTRGQRAEAGRTLLFLPLAPPLLSMTSLAIEQLRFKPSSRYAYEELDVEEPGAEEAGPRGGSTGHSNRTAGWAGWVCASLLLVAWALREGLPMLRGPLLVPTSDACRDPFTNPLGYIWRGAENNEIR